MDELKHATDLQELLEEVKDGAPVCPSEAYDLIKRIDRLMGENAALIANAVDAMGGFTDEPLTAEEFLAILKRKWQERDTWEEQAGKQNAALTAQVERLTAQVKMYAQPVCLQQFPRSWSTTGAEQVHAPKTIAPEPDQRRIETERFPQKGEK
jgi:hypothetical protein